MMFFYGVLATVALEAAAFALLVWRADRHQECARCEAHRVAR